MNKSQPRIYFDHNATSPMSKLVIDELLMHMDLPLNPSSLHYHGRNAKNILEAARERIKMLSGGADYNLIFTSSGTEANNLAIRGLGHMPTLTTPVEHSSVLQVVGVGGIAVDNQGIVRLDALEVLLKRIAKPALVSVIFANNETGVIQPIKEIAALVHAHEGLLHTDATQAFGKIPVNVAELGADLITISGHKFGGPVGAASLLVRKGIDLKPQIVGGGQELRFRSGTQNVACIHAYGVASEIAYYAIEEFQKIANLRDYLEEQLLRECPDMIIFGAGAHRLPNTSLISMPEISNETQLIFFDINGISVSAGSACSAGRVGLPHVQMAMGYSQSVAQCSIRVSLGAMNTREEVEYFINKWRELYRQKNLRKAI